MEPTILHFLCIPNINQYTPFGTEHFFNIFINWHFLNLSSDVTIKEEDEDEEGEEEEEEDDDEEEEDDKNEEEEFECYPPGMKVQVRYGRGKNQKMYEASIKDSDIESGEVLYLVHYCGWNMR